MTVRKCVQLIVYALRIQFVFVKKSPRCAVKSSFLFRKPLRTERNIQYYMISLLVSANYTHYSPHPLLQDLHYRRHPQRRVHPGRGRIDRRLNFFH